LSGVLIALAWSAAQAQPPAWYRVEIIVFADLDASSAGDEQWPLDPGTPPLDNAVELLDATDPETPEPELRLAYQRITGDALQLNAPWGRLRRSANYHPLLHIAWRQPALAQDEARPVHLRGGRPAPAAGGLQAVPAAPSAAPLPAEIDGTLRLYRARYLHLDLDLRYRPDSPPPGLTQQVEVFRLTESRRVRSRKLHYFDHPLFGVLALVTPLPEPDVGAPAEAQPGASSDATPASAQPAAP